MNRLVLMAFAGLLFAGCETISEEACMSGSWQDIGFKDGETGASRSRLAKISETCAKYGVSADRDLYFAGYEAGLVRYCSAETGYRAGSQGNDAHSECRAGGFTDYLDAYAEGAAYYAIVSERNDMIELWKNLDSSAYEIQDRLDNEEGLTESQRNSLLKELATIENEMDELRVDIRVYERLNGLDEWSPV